jgi:putative resolvase
MSVVGCVGPPRRGRLRCRLSASGQRLFDRVDLDPYLGRPVPAADASGRKRVEALYCQVSGSTGQEWSLANQERMLRVRRGAGCFGCIGIAARACGSRGGGLDRLLDDAAAGRLTVVRVVWRDRLARFVVAWMERYLSVCGVSVEALHERG